MNTKDQRNLHEAFPSGISLMEAVNGSRASVKSRAQMEIAKDMLYAEFGWDKTTGMPTRATFERLGMKAIADDLAAKGLLP